MGASDERPRWEYRFENFSRAFLLLREAVVLLEQRDLTLLEKEGLIQRFAYTWELAWKVLRDYLSGEGVVLESVTPRAVLRAAFAAGVIPDGEGWLAALDAWNRMAHTYNQKAFEEVVEAIRDRYCPLLDGLHATLERKRGADPS